MRRSPVLHEAGAPVPAHTTIELLEVGLAAPAGGDQISLVRALRLEADRVVGVVGDAERTREPRHDPRAAAQVARQAATPVFHQIAEARWRAAEGTDPEKPLAVAELTVTPCEVRLQPRPERAERDEGHEVGLDGEPFVDEADPSLPGEEIGGAALGRPPRLLASGQPPARRAPARPPGPIHQRAQDT